MGKADRYQKLYPVTWDQLHRDAKALAWRLLEQGPFKGIIGVARGGLVVDDLVDTGNTATIIRNMLPKAHFATLYSKPAGKPLVDTFITEVSQDTWILFPWDSEVQYTAPLVEQN